MNSNFVSVPKPILALYLESRLITSDSNVFLFCKYTDHLQVLFMSVFTKCSRQAQTFGVYVKQENERL